MFIPNEIITEILNISDYQTWKNKVDLLNQQYHSYYYLHQDNSITCKRHEKYVANWRNNAYDNQAVKGYIYPICVNTKSHKFRVAMISQINLPHNY